LAACCSVLTLTGCKRETRELRPSPAASSILGDVAAESALHPGSESTQNTTNLNVVNPYEGNAYAISEGQRLFNWYNCSGCHGNGGGGIGPPLIKKDQRDWIYGSEPVNIFDTIVKGRPNGMPTWGGKIPEYQVWQIVTYVRSLSKLEPKAATPPRADTLEPKTATIRPDKNGGPQPGAVQP
jgi:cytochrome c oxidase cbb3-type subunit 3